MCRILGWTGECNSIEQFKKVSLLIKGLILAEEKSNPHGTGLCVYTHGSGHQLVKKGLRGSAFILQGYADSVLRMGMKAKAVIGHVRFKTSGEQSDKNSHPFGFRIKSEWYFGMHNGVIGCTEALAKKYKIKEHSVDSATFLFCLAKVAEKKELVEAIEEVTYETSLTGDFAFAVMRKNEIYLWRNDSRPLCFFDLREEGLGRVFCSTKEMFEKAISLSGVSLKKKVSYFEAKPYRLYKMGHHTSPKFEIEVVKDLKYKEKPKLLPSIRYNYSWLEDYDRDWLSRTSCNSSPSCGSLFGDKKEKKKEKKKEEKKFDDPDDDLCFIAEMSQDELEIEILETEAEVYGHPPREELIPYLEALYEEWRLRIAEKGGQDEEDY